MSTQTYEVTLPKELPEPMAYLDDTYYVSVIVDDDRYAFLDHFREKVIHDQTLNIPYPYTEQHAVDWVKYRQDTAGQRKHESAFAIRRADGYLIGAVGTDIVKVGQQHRAELGYWLAKPYWREGIMTKAVAWFKDYAWGTLRLNKITAGIFSFNRGSARVLEKNGFQLEGVLREHYCKEIGYIDCHAYGLVCPFKKG